MLQIKIQGATPQSGKAICHTCKRAKKVKGQNCEEVIFCGLFTETKYNGIVPFKVAECADYHPMNVPWLHEMEDMAWKIEARRRGPTGFQQPELGEMVVIVTPPKSKTIPEESR